MRFHRLPSVERPALVSVVVPCYCYGNFVGAAVGSALEQEGVDVEVIIVDDASPDDSPLRIAEIVAEHPNVRALYHEVNTRHIATYNDGLADVQGDYVVLLSADDMLAPRSLARSVAIMQRYPSVGLVYGFAPDFDGALPGPRAGLPFCMVWPGDQWIRATMRCAENPVSTPTAILRRDLLDRIGGYDETLPHSGDLLMWLQAASMADVAYVSGVDLAYYRVHGSNMHTTSFGALHSDLSERARAFATFADEGSADRTELLCVARRALAREAEAALARIGTGDAAEVDPLRTFVEEQLAAAGSTSARRMSPRLPRSARALLDPAMSAANWRVWRRFGMRW